MKTINIIANLVILILKTIQPSLVKDKNIKKTNNKHLNKKIKKLAINKKIVNCLSQKI